MPACLLALAALVAPRVVLVGVWLFSDWFGRAFDGILFIVLGLCFLPLTTLVWAWAIHANGALEGGYLVALVVAVVMDLGAGPFAQQRSGD